MSKVFGRAIKSLETQELKADTISRYVTLCAIILSTRTEKVSVLLPTSVQWLVGPAVDLYGHIAPLPLLLCIASLTPNSNYTRTLVDMEPILKCLEPSLQKIRNLSPSKFPVVKKHKAQIDAAGRLIELSRRDQSRIQDILFCHSPKFGKLKSILLAVVSWIVLLSLLGFFLHTIWSILVEGVESRKVPLAKVIGPFLLLAYMIKKISGNPTSQKLRDALFRNVVESCMVEY